MQAGSTSPVLPILDVRTRWNSSYDMLVRARELKDVSIIILFIILLLLYYFKNYIFCSYFLAFVQNIMNWLHGL
jgi:hypothetical protein